MGVLFRVFAMTFVLLVSQPTIARQGGSDCVILAYSGAHRVYARFTDISAGHEPATDTEGFGRPLLIGGGEGGLLGASGALKILLTIPCTLLAGTFAIKGVIRTTD